MPRLREPNIGGKTLSTEKQPRGQALSGTPDPAAILVGTPLTAPQAEGQPITGTPNAVPKYGSKALKGRSTPGRSTTSGLKGTPNNG